MTDIERAHQRLRDTNPARVIPIDRPEASTFLASLESTPQPVRPSQRRGVLVAAAAFLATLAVGVGLWLVSLNGNGAEVVDPPPSTTSTPTSTTTAPPTTTTEAPVTTTTITPSTAAALEELAARYSAGDVDAFLALLSPGLQRDTIRDAEPPFVWDEELLRRQLDMDAALNTTIEMQSCRQLSGGAVTCLAARDNDLTRVAGVGPQSDRWSIRFEDGLVTTWTIVVSLSETPYQALAIAPFTAWLAESHPELLNPYPLSGGVSHWLRDVDFVAETPELVAEYAAANGVTLP